MFEKRKKPPVPGTGAKTDGGQETKRPKPPTIDGVVDSIDDVTQENDMADLFTELFGKKKDERCGC